MRALVMFAVFLLAVPAWAHGGGLDKYGCHVDSRTGQRHCHGDNPAPSTPVKSEGLTTGETVLVVSAIALLVGTGAYFLIKLNSDPFSMMVAPTPSGLLVTGTF